MVNNKMKLLNKMLIIILFSFSNYVQAKAKSEPYSLMMTDLYKTVKYQDQEVFYEIDIYNGACNYTVLINDLPVANMYRNARGKITIPINGKILKSGKQQLKIKIFPFYDKNRNIKNQLNDYAGLDVTVKKLAMKTVKKDIRYETIFEYQTPREGNASLKSHPAKLLVDEKLPYYEETVSFDAEIPYKLIGWSESVNLQKEDQKMLFKEVEKYYQELSKNFKNKSISGISKKYYNKEKEVAQSYFHDKKQAQTRWHNDILEVIINPTAKVMKLEK